MYLNRFFGIQGQFGQKMAKIGHKLAENQAKIKIHLLAAFFTSGAGFSRNCLKYMSGMSVCVILRHNFAPCVSPMPING